MSFKDKLCECDAKRAELKSEIEKINKKEMEGLLSHFVTKEGRINVVLSLINKRLEQLIPEKHLIEALDSYSDSYFYSYPKDIDIAAVYERAGLMEKAFEYHAEHGPIADVIQFASKKGLYKKAMEYLEAKECFNEAAKFAEMAGLKEKAKKLYLKTMEHYEKKGPLFCYGCDSDTAIHFVIASKAAAKAGLVRKSKELAKKVKKVRIKAMRDNEKAGYLEEAVKYAEMLGLAEKVKDLSMEILEESEKRGEFFHAAKYAEKAGLDKKAKKFYKKAMEEGEKNDRCDVLALAAEAAYKLGFIEKAENLCAKSLASYESCYNRVFNCLEVSAEKAERAGLRKKAEAYKKLAEMMI